MNNLRYTDFENENTFDTIDSEMKPPVYAATLVQSANNSLQQFYNVPYSMSDIVSHDNTLIIGSDVMSR